MLSDQIQQEMYAAMKARRGDEAAALRLVLSALKTAAIDAQAELSDDQALAVLTREAKRRREAEAAYRDAGRTERADQEAFELSVINRYLPERLEGVDLERLVDQVVAETGAAGPRDMGKVMGALMPRVKGRADGGEVRRLVQARLGA
jgi:uncharacterized protein YqeY